jgi:hypothetical protein
MHNSNRKLTDKIGHTATADPTEPTLRIHVGLHGVLKVDASIRGEQDRQSAFELCTTILPYIQQLDKQIRSLTN